MIYEGGNSKARNPRIQNMLRMIGYGENVGSGFPTIISAWNEARWADPELKNKIEVDEVELVLPLPIGAVLLQFTIHNSDWGGLGICFCMSK